MDVAGHMRLRKSLNRPKIHREVSPFNVRSSLIADKGRDVSVRCVPEADTASLDVLNLRAGTQRPSLSGEKSL